MVGVAKYIRNIKDTPALPNIFTLPLVVNQWN